MRRDRNVVTLGQTRNFPHLADASAAHYVRHQDVRRTAFENWTAHIPAMEALADANRQRNPPLNFGDLAGKLRPRRLLVPHAVNARGRYAMRHLHCCRPVEHRMRLHGDRESNT